MNKHSYFKRNNKDRKRDSACNRIERRIARRRCGQAFTEYAAIIAFIGVLISMVFAIGGDHISTAVKDSFSSVSNQLLALAAH